MADYPGKFLREHFQRRIEIQKKKNGMTKNEASSNSPIKKTSSKKPPTSIELKKTILNQMLCFIIILLKNVLGKNLL